MRLFNHLTAVYEPAAEGGYVAYIPEIPGASSQGETLDEARENLLDALDLLLEVRRELAQTHKTFEQGLTETLFLSDAA